MHVVDLMVAVNVLYTRGRAEAEGVAEALSESTPPGPQAAELTDVIAELQNNNPHVLFSRMCVQRMLSLLLLAKVSYLQNKSHVFGEGSTSQLQGTFHFYSACFIHLSVSM